MPSETTLERAKRDRQQGKAPSTQAGEFVREEIEHIRQGKHGARSAKQAIAIGLSKARRAGVDLKPPKAGRASGSTRMKAEHDYAQGHGASRRRAPSAARSAATERALKRESTASASSTALRTQAKAAARRRTHAERSAAAQRAVRVKGPVGRSAAARRAARTRARSQG